MDISSIGGTAMTPEAQMKYAVGLIKMSQASTEVLGSLIQDTVEISQEAMDRYLAELN